MYLLQSGKIHVRFTWVNAFLVLGIVQNVSCDIGVCSSYFKPRDFHV